MSKLIAINNWGPYGTWSGTAPTIFPYSISFPSWWSVVSRSSPAWLGVGTSDLALHVDFTAGANSNNIGPGVYYKYGRPQYELVHGFWFKPIAFPGSGTIAIWRANDTMNTGQTFGEDQIYIRLNTTGGLEFLNASNTSFGTTGTNLSAGSSYFFDIYAYIGDTNGGAGKQGSVLLNVYNSAGSLVTSITNANCQTRASSFTASYGVNSITFDAETFSGDTASSLDFGSGYILDPKGGGTGAMKGLRYFQPYFMSGASTPAQFVSSDSGTPLTELSAAPATTTPYQSNATQGQQSLFIPPQYAGGGTIDALGLRGVAEKDSEGARCFAAIVSSSGVTGANSRGLTNGTFNDFIDLYEVDPNTAVAWLVSGLNASKQGIEVFN